MNPVKFSPGKIYGVFRGSIITDEGPSHSHKSGESHYNLIASDSKQNETSELYQINIDIQSLTSPNVKCICMDPFTNSSIPFSNIPFGFTQLESTVSDALALDFVRRPIFDLNLLVGSTPLSADDIAAKLDVYLKTNTPNVIIFGTKYDDQHVSEENHYGLQRAIEEDKPPRGIDDIHMNQIVDKDGHAYQDGALFIQKEDQDDAYVAFFFCFDNQCKTKSLLERIFTFDFKAITNWKN